MSHTPIFHAIGLHMHQPPGNLRLLIDEHAWEARQIIHCYDRATRYAHKYPDTARLHVAFSGILLEQLQDPAIVEAYKDVMDIPAMLESYRHAENIELLSTGYYHPVFSMIPPEDWEEQLVLGREQMEKVFGRAPKGFYPPAMMFSAEMIPALLKAGYEYVVLDAWQIKSPAGEGLDPFRPYLVKHDGKSIAVVVKEMDLSNAQHYGTDLSWFADESRHRTGWGEPPRLLTTWSDGENTEWFRNMDEPHGFFGGFFAPYMEHSQGGEYPLQPMALSEFLEANPPRDEARVEVPHWNASKGQRQALERIQALDGRYRELNKGRGSAKLKEVLPQVRNLILESETSCYLFWSDTWLGKIHEHLDTAEKLLEEATMPAKTPAKSTAPAAKAEAEPTAAEPPPAKAAAAAKAPAAKAEAEPAAAQQPPAEASPAAATKPAADASKKKTTAGATRKTSSAAQSKSGASNKGAGTSAANSTGGTKSTTAKSKKTTTARRSSSTSKAGPKKT